MRNALILSYVEVSGADVRPSDFTAIVISSDLRRTGHFKCSHAMLQQLYDNTVRSIRGNFVSVPTDCPQRDERLGWTADLQVIAPTASFLFDTGGFLSSWLRGLHDQTMEHGGIAPEITPKAFLFAGNVPRPMAIWGDTAVLTPWDVYTATSDYAMLEKQYESMRAWLDQGIPREENGLWRQSGVAYGDWLDPRAVSPNVTELIGSRQHSQHTARQIPSSCPTSSLSTSPKPSLV